MRAVCNYIQPDVGADLKQAPSSLTSLTMAKWTHKDWAQRDDAAYDRNVLQGISSLRRLSCKVHAPDFLLHLTSVLY